MIGMERTVDVRGPETTTTTTAYSDMFPSLTPRSNQASSDFKALDYAAAGKSSNKHTTQIHAGTVAASVALQIPGEYFREPPFGEPTRAEATKQIALKTNTRIETSVSKNGTVSFVVNGKADNVSKAKRELKQKFMKSVGVSLFGNCSLPKNHEGNSRN